VIFYIIDTDTPYNLLLRRPWINANLIVLFTLHQCIKYVDDKVMVRMVFAKTQTFKRVENYFTDSLLYKENGKVVKKSLPDDIDSGNKADSESGDDPSISFDEEPIITYLNDPDYNNSADNGEVLDCENVNFDYSLCYDDVVMLT